MARHLKTVTHDEWADLQDRVLDWLDAHDVAGSIAGEYSLYRALDEEREKAEASGDGDPEPGEIRKHG